MRVDLLELDKLPDIPEEEKDRLQAAGILDKNKSLSDPWPKPMRDPGKKKLLDGEPIINLFDFLPTLNW